MQKNQFLKEKKSLLKLEKDFVELKDSELNDREVKIKRRIEELFFKPIIVSIRSFFEQKERKKIRPIRSTWYDWLFNYIPESIRKSVGGFKDKVINLFKTNTPKQSTYGKGKKLSKPKTQNKNKTLEEKEENTDRIDRIIINI